MLDPFERGKAWFLYSKLERDFIDTTSYVALENVHSGVWSEKFGEILTRTGDLVDSFFRLMINCRSLDAEASVKALRAKILAERKANENWFPKIGDFGTAFDPVFQLSSVEVEADYGLTYYGKLCPFKNFDKQSPSWWEPYNSVKHEIFEQIERKATLENAINALASLFTLNILHKESQEYLLKYQDVVLFDNYRTNGKFENLLDIFKASKTGIPKGYSHLHFKAVTPLFAHVFRVDERAVAK